MTVAKNYPGQLDTEYCAGMNMTPLPTICASVSTQVREAYSREENDFLPLGTKDYTVIMWCSSATLFHGPGGQGNFTDIQKLGGLYINTMDNVNQNIGFQGMFSRSNEARTMDEVYGSTMEGFSNGGGAWASELTFNLLCPNATLVGACYKGSFMFG